MSKAVEAGLKEAGVESKTFQVRARNTCTLAHR
jgi:hypothetical protein